LFGPTPDPARKGTSVLKHLTKGICELLLILLFYTPFFESLLFKRFFQNMTPTRPRSSALKHGIAILILFAAIYGFLFFATSITR
jgi:hypothetical protein